MSLHFDAKTTNRAPAIADADPRLCIQWDIGSRSADAALEMRNAVTEKAEALLDASGLLIDWDGASIGDETVETTFAVADYETARDVVWSSLSETETAHNCRIFEEPDS